MGYPAEDPDAGGQRPKLPFEQKFFLNRCDEPFPRDATVVELHAAFMADDKLYCCEERWINPAAVPEIPAGAFDSLSPYEWLSQCVGMNHGRKSISSALPAELPPFVAAAFETARKTATLRIEQVLWADAVAVTMSRCYYPHGHSLEMDL